ncbi:flagellar filament capping protein FliD [Hydrogenimonas sp. SS33]|uniref:flagellar filament capping protein FliD n=1 Tax=Hydrogenimonas leucolamina TaxID=2954236 RepID=UPI00336BB580
MANFGALSSLGLGSSGALSYDIIDKLRKVDEENQIKPIDSQIADMKKREEELAKITTMAATLKSSLFELSDSVLFAKRTVDVTGSDVAVEVEDGAAAQEIDVTVKNLAKAAIDQTKGFASKESVVTTVDTDMTIDIDGGSTTFTVAAGTTLSQLKEQIAEEMKGKVDVTLLNTGGDEPWRLVLKSSETGADQAMSFSFDDHDANTAGDDFLALTAPEASVQSAADALFTFNGVDITRPSNTVGDLVVGVTFTLKNEGTSPNHISIKRDDEAITAKVQDFVDRYNTLMGELTAATKYDPETKKAGILQGESEVVSLKLSVARLALGTAPDGKGLADYGIDVTREGVMSFDSSKLQSALKNDVDEVSQTFAGTEEKPGVFLQLKNYLSDAATDRDSLLSNLDDRLKAREKSLEKRKERAQQTIETRYDVMAKRFAAYDALIGKLNASFQSLQSMIDAQANAKK